ncbi:MAG: DUF368 domain-containing protein [Chloroflexi bacterium]|nr:DUF368 domain-containing protein [Chloroflexota bacterium]
MMARGFVMGSADVVPGVSGGTMAFILGIYEELIQSISDLTNRDFLEALLKLRVKQAMDMINWRFLLAVAVGIMLAIFTLAQALEWLLENQPVLLWSFFFGLILASVFVVARRIEQWQPTTIGAMILGAIISYLLVGLIPAQTPNAWWFLILCGALAITAMVLPGVSGAFILVLLGKYQYILGAVNDRDVLTLALVSIGAGIGIVSIARAMSWLFKKYHDLTIALLIGLMIGSLRKIWPWKQVETFIVGSHGEQIPTIERNILPSLTVNGSFNSEVLIAAGLAILAIVAVLLIERFSSHAEPKNVPEVAEVPAK